MFSKKNKKCVSILINSHSIVAVEVSYKKNKPRVTNYSKTDLAEGIVESNCIVVNLDEFKKSVETLFKNGRHGAIKTKEVYLALPEENTFSHQIIIPTEQTGNTDYIKQQAENFIPIELDEAVFDYKVIKEDTQNHKVTLKFIAAKKIIVESLIKTFKELDLEILKIDADIDCLIRTFQNSLNQNEGDFLLINKESNREIISLTAKDGQNYRIISKTSAEESELKKRIENLIKITSANTPIELKTIYLTGSQSRLPEVKETVSKMFPKATIKNNPEFTEIPNENGNDLLTGIGICLSRILGKDQKDFNLLPEEKKEELSLAPFIPKINHYLMLAIILLLIPLISMGIKTAKDYIDYEVRSREVVILTEQTLNPYLRSIAQLKNERQQIQQQILAVLGNSVPVSIIIKSLNDYSKDGTELVNVSYKSNAEMSHPEVLLNAETKDRETTEAFIEALGKNELYKQVNSPISNLVSKGKRLINISLVINRQKVIDRYNQIKNNNE